MFFSYDYSYRSEYLMFLKSFSVVFIGYLFCYYINLECFKFLVIFPLFWQSNKESPGESKTKISGGKYAL